MSDDLSQGAVPPLDRPQTPANDAIAPASSFSILGTMALVCALLGIACASILLVIAEQDISPYAATFDRLSVATVIFGAWLLGKGMMGYWRDGEGAIASKTDVGEIEIRARPDLSDMGLFLLAGLAFSGSLSLWAWSLTQTSVANSTLLNNMMPIFTTLGAWLIYRQTFSRRFLVGMGVAIAGAVIIGLEDLQLTDGFVGDEAALVASVLSAVSILSIEQLRTRFSTPWIMMWTSLVGSLFLASILWGLHDNVFPTSVTAWSAVIALGVISQALGQGLLTYSLKAFPAGLVAVSMLSIPVIAAVLAVLLLAERLSLMNWLAFAIVLFGIYLAVSSRHAGVSSLE